MRYHPRLMKGFGFCDGEQVERLWSEFCPVIRLNRPASSFLRLSNLHFLKEFVNESRLEGLSES